MRSMRKWDPGHDEDAVYTSSEDEDELSRLKPTTTTATSNDGTISTATPSQQQQQLPATPSGGKTSQNTAKGNRGGQQRSSSGSVGLGRNYYLGPPVTGSGATSPNDSDNTYAEASLLAHGRYEHNNADVQNTRYDQELVDYDSEIYANGALETGANHRYQQILQQQQQRSPLENRQHYANNRDFRQIQQMPESKSPFLSSGTASTRTNARSSSSMASSGRRGGSGGSSSTTSGPNPPMLPSDPPGTRRAGGGHMVLSERNWETVGTQNLGSFGSPQGGDPNNMLETRMGPRDVDHLRQFNNNASATLMAGERRNRNPIGFGTSLHRRSLSDDSLGVEKPVNSSHLHHVGGGLASPDRPVVMPGFPVRTMQAHPPPPYSPTREKFLAGKKCHFHCSWKLVALALTLLTLILSSVIAYFGAVKFPGSVQHPSALPESVISTQQQISRLDCPPISTINDQQQITEFVQTQGGQPQAVLPQGGQGFGIIPEEPSVTSSFPPVITVSPLIPGQWYTVRVEPMTFWRSRLTVRQPSHYQMNLTIVSADGVSRPSSLAIYGREGQAPTVTTYDWVHMVTASGDAKTLVKRSTGSIAQNPALANLVTVDKLLTSGDWFISVLNDGDDTCTVRAVVGQKRHGKSCLNECNGQGTCDDGVCRCFPQFSGQDCSLSVCPLLCSGHGVYGGGQCHCVDGWKGPECDVRETECIFPDCSGHGHCQEGVCICKPGWTGEHCQIRDCYDRQCSGHGTCSDGNCQCDLGWMGRHCEKRNEALFQCLPDCSGHGRFDAEHGKCDCQTHWTGRDCNITLCSLDCGPNGRCLGSSCVCSPGWEGPLCQNQACDDRCSLHGQCKNGSCVCRQGFHGQHCTLVGCGEDALCHGRGVCEVQGLNNNNNKDGKDEMFYSCRCNDGWTGNFCEIGEETDCEDSIDNDGNGLTDCGDSKCCSHDSCKKSIMCLYLADPVEVLLRKPPPTVTASFLKRVQFLFEGEESVQNYAKQDVFDDKRVSIIRGRVITMSGQGIIGVRVSVDRTRDATNYGFTLTRPGGWFDMAVNGGGGVTLQFQRSPLKATTRTTYLPWNRIIVINPVVMTPYGGAGISWDEEDTSNKVRYFQPCLDHDYETIRPLVMTSYIPELLATESPLKGGIFPEMRLVRESIRIPGSDLYLMYRSSSSPGAMSTIDIKLTPDSIPESLSRIHLVVRVSGVVFKKSFEADPGLKFTFAWDKRNVYNQKVYGVVDAEVSVGYQYTSCAHTLWVSQMTRLKGFDVDISHIGGWNLNIHHHYNPYQGILQKGDGSILDFKMYPKLADVVMGTEGQKRPLECSRSECDGQIGKVSPFLNVVSLTTGPDGSVYVGDYNIVRKVTTDGKVWTILQFGATQGTYDYDLSVSPADNMLYLSHAKKHQVWKIETLDGEKIKDPKNNWKPVVGTGERCLPGSGDDCGDGGPANEARLDYPKSVAISVDRTMYISDGRNLRVVTPEGRIDTLVGGRSGPVGPPRPPECQRIFEADDVRLQWPTKLALSPLDNTLHIVDDSMVLRLTPDMRLQAVAGISPLCEKTPEESGDLADRRRLGPIGDIDFAPDGTLYLLETSLKKKKRSTVYYVDRHRKIRQVEAHMRTTGNATTGSDASSILQSAIAITVNPDEGLYLASDERLARITHAMPERDESGDVRVAYPLTRELYTFNRFSQHVSTHNLDTGSLVYTFTYSKNTVLGRLAVVADPLGNKIALNRDYTNRVQSIDNTFGQKHNLKLTTLGHLESIQLSGDDESTSRMITLGYDDDTSGLLVSRHLDNGNFAIYEYDRQGRAKTTAVTSGDYYTVEESELCEVAAGDTAICLDLTRNGELLTSLKVHQSGRTLSKEGDTCAATFSNNNSDWSMTSQGCIKVDVSSLTLHPSLRHLDPLLFGLQRIPSNVRISRNDGNPFDLSWTYEQSSEENIKQIGMEKGIVDRFLNYGSNERLLRVSFNAEKSEESFSDGRGQILINVKYKNGVLPIEWSSHVYNNCTQTFDRIHRLVERRCDRTSESLTYNDRNGHLEEVKRCQKRPTKFAYGNTAMPRDIILPSGRRYSYEYDNSEGLAKIKLPANGGIISVELQTGFFGKVRFSHKLPGFNEPHVTYWSGDGRLLQVRPPVPGVGGITVYRYTPDGKIKFAASGSFHTEFAYHPEGWLTRVDHETDIFSMKQTELRVTQETSGDRSQVLTERRLTFDPKSGFASAKYTYSYGSGLNLVSISGRIGGQTLPSHFIRHSLSLILSSEGVTKDIGQFYVHVHNLNETTISDGVATYARSDSTESLLISGRELYRATYGLDGCGRLDTVQLKIVRAESELQQVLKYTYDEDGQLEVAGIDRAEYRYAYDDNGNLLSADFTGSSSTSPERSSFEYNSFGRLARQKGQRFFYEFDPLGRVVVDRHRNRLGYEIGDLLSTVDVALEKGLRVTYYYDHLGRLTGRKDTADNSTQYFYAFPDRPYLVSHVFSSRAGRLTSLVYDDQDRLMFADVDQRRYYVVSDRSGSPWLFLTPTGKIVREIGRTPYGQVTFDSEKHLGVPIGFAGGIYDPVTQLVHIQGPSGSAAYDPFTGSFLIPRWKSLLSNVLDPLTLRIYRYPRNDPINQKINSFQDAEKLLEKLEQNLQQAFPAFSLENLKQIVGFPMDQSVTKVPPSSVQIINEHPQRWREGHEPMTPASSISFASVFASISRVSSVTQSPLRFNPNLKISFSRKDPPVGKYVLVSLSQGNRALVRAVSAGRANEVTRDIFSAVLDGANVVDYTAVSHGGVDAYFFTKENVWESSEDIKALYRLGPLVNLTTHDTQTDAGMTMDVKVHLDGAVINIRYGTSAESEKARILRHAFKTLTRRAWSREKDSTVSGIHPWDPNQRQQLMHKGNVEGFEVVYKRDAQLYPELANDLENVQFVAKQSNSQRRRFEN